MDKRTIIAEIVEVANALDDKNMPHEADILTKIAQSLMNVDPMEDPMDNINIQELLKGIGTPPELGESEDFMGSDEIDALDSSSEDDLDAILRSYGIDLDDDGTGNDFTENNFSEVRNEEPEFMPSFNTSSTRRKKKIIA